MSIPKVIHQIWIGPKDPPTKWIDTWKEKNSDFTHILWRDDDIDDLGLQNQKAYEYYIGKNNYHGASDVVRYELIFRFGGIYLDADSKCIRPLCEAEFLKKDFFVSYSPNLPKRVSSGWIGAKKEHFVLRACIEGVASLYENKELEPPWNTVGGTLLTSVVRSHPGLTVLPAITFYGVDINSKPIRDSATCYSIHYAGSTHDLY